MRISIGKEQGYSGDIYNLMGKGIKSIYCKTNINKQYHMGVYPNMR